MKIALAFLLCFVSVTLHAAGSTPFSGVNKYGEVVIVQENLELETEKPVGKPDYFYWAVEVKKKGKTTRRYPRQPCSYMGPFMCSKDGKSPLAGTTYIETRMLKKCGGFLYVCKKGCGPSAPQVLIKSHYECPNAEGDMAACQSNNNSTMGVVNSNKVIVRSNPRTSAKVLHYLMNENEVKILERRGKCLDINNERGQWVKIKIVSKGRSVVGWVYDAYIDYHGSR